MKYFMLVLAATLFALAAYFYASKDTKPEVSFVPNKVSFSFPTLANQPSLRPTKVNPALPSLIPTPKLDFGVSLPFAVENEIALPPLSPGDFLGFTQKLQQHLDSGLQVSELERLYQQGKRQNWPTDWIFSPVENKGPFKVAYNLNEVASLTRFGLRFSHNFFTVSTAQTLENSDPRKSQVKAFERMLAACELCNKTLTDLIDLPTLREINSAPELFSDHKIGLALASVYRLQRPHAYQFSEKDYEQLESDISLLLKSENEYLRQHGQFSQQLSAGDSAGLMVSLSNMTSMSYASLIQFIKFSQPLTQAQSYQVIYQRLKNSEPPQDMTRLLDFVIYHGQYFSIREAIELLNLVSGIENPLIDEIWTSFKRAQDRGFDTVAEKWLQARKQNPVVLEGIVGRKGGQFKAIKAKSNFILQMMATQNIEKMQKKWQREFSDTELANALFSEMNWPSLLENISLNSVPGTFWNQNVSALTQANIKHSFDTLSTLHLRLIQRLLYDTVANANQLEELKYLYPRLLPSEKEWIGRALESEAKRFVVDE